MCYVTQEYAGMSLRVKLRTPPRGTAALAAFTSGGPVERAPGS